MVAYSAAATMTRPSFNFSVVRVGYTISTLAMLSTLSTTDRRSVALISRSNSITPAPRQNHRGDASARGSGALWISAHGGVVAVGRANNARGRQVGGEQDCALLQGLGQNALAGSSGLFG
jgi:hypothetical protein